MCSPCKYTIGRYTGFTMSVRPSVCLSTNPMSYDNLSCVSKNLLKFYQLFTGEERRIPFIFDDFHFCRSRVIGGKNLIFRHIKSNNSGTAKVKIVKNERDPPLFTGKLLIKFQNILRNFWRFSLLLFQSNWTWYDGKYDFYPMSYNNLSSVSQNG
jgi:hypothetical protein